LEILSKGGDFEYVKLDTSAEVDSYTLVSGKDAGTLGSGFGFFMGMGIIDYKSTFKAWLRQFPRPLFIIAVQNRNVVGWTYVEEWSEGSLTGDAVYVLRAIEVIPKFRRRKVATRLLLLSMKHTVGFLITKPLNSGAEAFFQSNGFRRPEEFPRQQVDLTSHHGYVVLTPYAKKDALDRLELAYFSPPPKSLNQRHP